ncbi:response regulator transcription factor [Saxibacter everestensis]|uniref:Response regulator transcription factor n=1 Tax=Saxibacter everestensis TaxID=2909229 RepID=A0ABY8QWT0_9MICO|nr:response regulator transcription factor [Brevibacteriaceae bacterium ZFBP1038]
MSTIRVLIADDHSAIRAGLRMILESCEDIEVVAEAGDGATALRMAEACKPDVILMDIRMPGLDGIATTRQLVQESAARVIMLTTFDIDDYIFAALKAGAAGFLLKSIEAPALIDAIRTAHAGDGVLSPAVTKKVLLRFASLPEAPVAPELPAELSGLTEREFDVLRCLGAGLSNVQIARRLVVAETTVKTHVSRVLSKLQLSSRVQVALFCREHGIDAVEAN